MHVSRPKTLLHSEGRLLQASGEQSESFGKAFWATQREEVLRCTVKGELSLLMLGPVAAAFARAGELTPALASAAARRFCAAFKVESRADTSPHLLQEIIQPDKRDSFASRWPSTFENFKSAATVLLAMKEADLLTDPDAGPAARALQDALLVSLQFQRSSATFSDLRRVLLLLGATAEPLGICPTTARELLKATKKQLWRLSRRDQGAENRDPRDSISLLWPLASISEALKLPPPQKHCRHKSESDRVAYTSKGERGALQQDRDIVLNLLNADVFRALSSRLPCSSLDLALGYIGLERLGLHHSADYVLAAFSAAAGAASREELCCLGREILLTGALQNALWGAFADAAATALEKQWQDTSDGQKSNAQQRSEAELLQWLRFCGRVI
ncbi:uncharacterized protein LOC34618669 [Cyclospora cayetanensis]|uniref:Uncharacterized protein LOC34618669 n=1 Tax=Cyclospora cayetanensis TaxID=88456 RepID=A0A6P6RPD1_9EIME|nr:uncharacterized protein LOC34618669 [Cyclospora cayetanensis]